MPSVDDSRLCIGADEVMGGYVGSAPAFLPSKVLSILRAAGAGAHMYMPGPGVPVLGPELSSLAGQTITASTQPDNIQLAVGKRYRYSATVNKTSGSDIDVGVAGTSYGWQTGAVTYVTANGVSYVSGEFNATDALGRSSVIFSGGAVGSVTEFSVKEITGYTNWLNGFQAGNYLESTGNTNAALDGGVGLALDAAGGIGSPIFAASNVSAGAAAGGIPVPGLSTAYPTVAGKSYRVTYAITACVGQLSAQVGGQTGTVQAANWTGTYSEVLVAANTGSNVIGLVGRFAGLTSCSGSVTVQELAGIHASQATTANKPVLRRGIVNLLTYSNDFTNAAWVKGGGNFVGDTFTAIGTAQFFQAVSVTPGGVYTFAFKCRKVDMTTQNLAFYDNIAGTFVQDNVSYISRISTSEFSLVTASVTVPAGCTSMRVYPLRNSGWAGESARFESAGLFAGTLNAQQIIAAGGIPLTTTAPASSQYGIGLPELGPDLLTNGNFSNGNTGWATNNSQGTGTAVISGGVMTITRVDASNFGARVSDAFSTVPGRLYRVSFDVSGSAAWVYKVGATGASFPAGRQYFDFVATSATSNLGFEASGNASTAVIDNVSVCEITAYRSLPGSYSFDFGGSHFLNIPAATASSGVLLACAVPASSGWLSIAGSGGQIIATPGVSIGFTPTNSARLLVGDGSAANISVVSSGVNVNPGIAYVVSGRWSPSLKEIRVNGVLRASSLSSVNPASGNTFAIGRISATETDYFNGRVFVVIFINGTISDSDLRILERWAGSLGGVPLS